MGVGQVVLSQDGKRLGYSMLNGRVTVKDINLESTVPRERTKVVYSEKKSIHRGVIRQLLFQVGGNLLLVAGTERIQILSLPSGETVATLEASDFQIMRHGMWAVHPNDPARLLAFSNDGVRGYGWENLQLPDIPAIIQADDDPSLKVQHPAIESLQPSFHPRMSLALTSTEKMGSKCFKFLVFEKAAGNSTSSTDIAVKEVTVPDRLSEFVLHPVGILQDGRLVFLDTYLWVCTLPLQSIGSRTMPTRHFFVPRDWINNAGMMLCSMLKDGTILCPRRGELAAIRNDIEAGW
jgi:hypothetical protein